jgi:hypothetical protein
MKHAEAIALAGAEITCPNCNTLIGVLRKPLYQGWHFGLDAIRFAKGQVPKKNQAVCRTCGASYAEMDYHATAKGTRSTMLVHTRFGWLPRRPPDVAAPSA